MYVLGALIVCAFLLGGSSRPEMPGLMILNPLSALGLGYGLFTLRMADIARYRVLMGLGLCVILLAILHVIPLPPSIWHGLPGRETIVAIDAQLGLQELWRPFTMDPTASYNALAGLLLPAAVLVLAIQMQAPQHEKLLALLLIIGFLSAFLSLGQIIGDAHGPLYLYAITNNGFPVGLFANRNHHAVFLDGLLPLTYAWVMMAKGNWRDLESARGRRAVLGGGLALLIVAIVLVAGSRAGLICLLIAVTATLAIVSLAPKRKSSSRARKPVAEPMWKKYLPAAATVATLGAIVFATVVMGRARSFERFVGLDPIADMRGQIAPTVIDIIGKTFPWGTGIGSFDNVFRMFEPDSLLSDRYVNHAHNDFLEFAMTGGLPLVLIILVALGWIALQAFKLLRMGIKRAIAERLLAVCALLALGLTVIGSIVDYPLRTAAYASYAIMLLMWLATAGKRDADPQNDPAI